MSNIFQYENRQLGEFVLYNLDKHKIITVSKKRFHDVETIQKPYLKPSNNVIRKIKKHFKKEKIKSMKEPQAKKEIDGIAHNIITGKFTVSHLQREWIRLFLLDMYNLKEVDK